jgi:hypothetical protein
MKNIHLLKTSNPSKILKDLVDKTYQFKKEATFGNRIELPLNIYITSDEEIKEDYVFAYGVIIKVMIFDVETLYFVNGTKAKREDCKKIILTTDQELIKDGVQAIDDEFLEWFVKNPSCEYVRIEHERILWESGKITHYKYKIIIPKEKPKQETLEEVAEIYTIGKSSSDVFKKAHIRDFMAGAKWQQEQDKNKYSEEEVGEIVYNVVGELAKYHGVIIDGAKLNELLNNLKTNKI